MVTATRDRVETDLPGVWRAEDLLAHPDDMLPDPPPRDDMQEEDNVHDSATTLRAWFKDEEALVTGKAYLCVTTRPPGDTRMVVPDTMVAFGLTKQQLMETRNGYVISEVGYPPGFVLEVASESTGTADYTYKRDIYMDFRVTEILRFDATGGLYHDAALAGDRLVDGEYVEIPVFDCPTYVDDEAIHVHSEVLGLDICWWNGRLQYYDPQGGNHFGDMGEAWDARDAAEARAEALEEEVRRLREEIRRLRGG